MELKKGDVLVSNGSRFIKGIELKVIDLATNFIILEGSDSYRFLYEKDVIWEYFDKKEYTINFDSEEIEKLKEKFEAPKHYDNSKGTLYKVAEERGWNSYLFDIVKRLERANKKGEFESDLNKSKLVIDLWLKEQK